ncbi:MAG TPA: MBL fold metallo-hydrolase [Opitutaceae bacterium]|nr:MBL fold metallo-hydrolase [Opitutaceae bacterium]
MLLPLSVLRAADTLDLYAIDTEGGKAVMVVSPGGGTMLIDAGYPTKDDRDTNRIVAMAGSLGIDHFDYIVASHYDADHVGNIPRLDARIPGRIFVDHGEPLPTDNAQDQRNFYEPYRKAIGTRQRLIVKPGDTIPLPGVQITVVTAGGEALAKALPGAGQPNEFASGAKPEPIDVYDNAGSVGLLFEFGKFRLLDLADLLQRVEYKLMVPVNRVGPVDLFMVSHHGYKYSNSRLLVHALHPRVAIMNNGPHKGGDPEVFDILKSSPGMQDLWQLHASPAAGAKNAPADFIANPEEACAAKAIKVSAQRDGTFTVTNLRNGFAKTYRP